MTRAVIVLAMLASSIPATARDWPDVAGWTIFEVDDGCGLHSEFQGPGDTELAIVLLRDSEDVRLVATNSNWSTVEKQRYPDIEYDTSVATYTKGTAVGVTINSKKGFATNFEPDFADAFVKSPYLHIRRGDVMMDKLGLAGSAAALAKVRVCVATLRAEKRRADAAAEAERRRYSGITRDPFAADKGTGQGTATGVATGATLRGGSISDDDYPAAAIAAGESGRTVATYTVGTDGRVSACSASGAGPVLDAETCRLIQLRFSFKPAEDGAGNTIAETRTQSIVWRRPAVPSPQTRVN